MLIELRRRRLEASPEAHAAESPAAKFDAANASSEQSHVESSLESVEHGLFDAIVGRQAADENARPRRPVQQFR